MNYIKRIRISLFAAMLILTIGNFTSCVDDIHIGNIDESSYETVKDVYGYLRNYKSSVSNSVIEIFDGEEHATGELYFGLTKVSHIAVDVKLKIDETVLTEYNKENGTNYEMFPTSLVTIEENGAILIAPGAVKSDPITITVSKSDLIEYNKTYMLPLLVESASNGVKLSTGSKNYIYCVKFLKTPNPRKDSGIMSFCYQEVNSLNILSVGEYTLKNSGKPFYDVVFIFAANGKFNEETGRSYCFCNENVQWILDHREKYIKPLQDKGIKVSLSILGGIANFTPEAARDFAQELKKIVETYGLDGVDFDDEYDSYDASVPGHTTATQQTYARLVYEVKKAMPDKLVTLYHIGKVGFNFDVDGMEPGEFIDYAYYPYYGSYNTSGLSTYKGMNRSQWGPYPLNLGSTSTFTSTMSTRFNNLRNDGYGVNLHYCLPSRDYSSVLNPMSQIIYNEQVEFSGIIYDKDW
ncbi:BT_3987 domain-containing protein [Gaoshiqia sp. Z1-71]|uniref:BT_3987 domain-containing protein n=1 Tax=Gaoshiqia hydrogeniformans TaxID=3290090 RepID=UPI003BF900EA